MKKMILTAILGTSLLSASAQVIEKGRKVLGGSIALNAFGNKQDSILGGSNSKMQTVSFQISPM